jgi:hypothetical protein
MTKLLDEAVKVLRGLPEDEQETAARAIIDYGGRGMNAREECAAKVRNSEKTAEISSILR